MKTKSLKKIVSLLCATAMTMSLMMSSVGAIHTLEAETGFSVKFLDMLPKQEGESLNRFRKYMSHEKLAEKKSYPNVKYPYGKDKMITKNVDICEKKTYDEIKELVGNFISEAEECIKKYDNNGLSKDLLVANSIYSWVAQNIEYDKHSTIEDKRTGKQPYRKPQDPLFVFSKQIGVCVGISNLVKLMMRMAEIPCVVVISQDHAFNAVYLNDSVNNRKGWTLLDATWAGPNSDMNQKVKTGSFKTLTEEQKRVGVKNLLNDITSTFIKEDSFGKISSFDDITGDGWLNWVNDFNKINDRKKVKRSQEYCREFFWFFKDLWSKHKDILYSNGKSFVSQKNKTITDSISEKVKNMNNEIKTKLEELNKNYTDIIQLDHVEVTAELSDKVEKLEDIFEINFKFNLSEKEAKDLVSKIPNHMEFFFPAFYNSQLNFESANEELIDMESHKFRKIVCDDFHDDTVENENFNFEIDNVQYIVNGSEDAAILSVKGNKNAPLEGVILSADILKNWESVRIEEGIKSLILKGNEVLYLEKATDLENVNADESNKYICDGVALYDKVGNNKKGNIVKIFDKKRFFNNDSVQVYFQMNNDKIMSVVVYSDKDVSNITIPNELIKLGVPIKIGSGIKSIFLTGDENLDLSEAKDLEKIEIKNSSRYMLVGENFIQKMQMEHQ